jgi:hypothetical protein
LFTMFSSSIVWVVARQVTGEYNIRARRENSRPATVSAVQLTIWRSKVKVQKVSMPAESIEAPVSGETTGKQTLSQLIWRCQFGTSS